MAQYVTAEIQSFYAGLSVGHHLHEPLEDSMGRDNRSSSVYSDDRDWVARISRLSVPPGWNDDERDVETAASAQSTPQHYDQSSPTHEKLRNVQQDEFKISRDLYSRNACIAALIISICAGIASLTCGCQIILSGRPLLPGFLKGKYMTMGNFDYPFGRSTSIHYLNGHRIFSVPEVAMLTISFLLNICLTGLFDCMAFIQSTTLRWALCKEGRLKYNSNPRLFTGARHFAPNLRITNAFASLALIVGYGSISALTCSVYIVGFADPVTNDPVNKDAVKDKYAIDFNGWGFVGLGSALLLQGAISTWCLAKSKIVPSWNSNPFNTALVCAILSLDEVKKPQRATTARSTSSNSLFTTLTGYSKANVFIATSELPEENSQTGVLLTLPRPRQPPMRLEVARARHFTYIIWIVFSLTLLWVLLNTIFGIKKDSCSASFVSKMTYRTDFLAYWSSYCQVSIRYYLRAYTGRRDWLGLIVQCLAFSFITLALHCAELVTDMTRDEEAWRKAATTGADAGRGALMEGATAWACWVMFGFKTVTPWMFGFAFDTNNHVFSNLIPVCVLSLILLLLALFAEYLVRRRPRGPQPTTYGNVRKLAGLVDEWHPRIFWGDKGGVEGRVRRAGTAGRRLAELDMAILYTNLRV